MTDIIQIILPIFTLTVGWVLARSREREKDRQDKTLSVYSDLIEVMALVQRDDFINLADRLFSLEELSHDEAHAFNNVSERFNKSHMNLMVFGSERVVRAVSDWYAIEDLMPSMRRNLAHITILKEMRSDGYQKSYEEFSSNVDNILISGPVARHQRLVEKKLAEKEARS